MRGTSDGFPLCGVQAELAKATLTAVKERLSRRKKDATPANANTWGARLARLAKSPWFTTLMFIRTEVLEVLADLTRGAREAHATPSLALPPRDCGLMQSGG